MRIVSPTTAIHGAHPLPHVQTEVPQKQSIRDESHRTSPYSLQAEQQQLQQPPMHHDYTVGTSHYFTPPHSTSYLINQQQPPIAQHQENCRYHSSVAETGHRYDHIPQQLQKLITNKATSLLKRVTTKVVAKSSHYRAPTSTYPIMFEQETPQTQGCTIHSSPPAQAAKPAPSLYEYAAQTETSKHELQAHHQEPPYSSTDNERAVDDLAAVILEQVAIERNLTRKNSQAL